MDPVKYVDVVQMLLSNTDFEMAPPSHGIHRGRLDNVMKDHISKRLPKKISKNIFKNFENFREIFSFSRFRKYRF